MSEPKYTPGPWEWDGDLLSHPAHKKFIKYVAGEIPEQQPHAEPIIQTDGGYYGPRGADRLLIAASPDMYEAIVSLLAYAHSPDFDPIFLITFLVQLERSLPDFGVEE